MTMATDADNRSARPFQRQAGFNVAGAEARMASADGSRIRTTTGDTIVRGSFDDDDVEMGDEKRNAVIPVPIPRSLQESAEIAEGDIKAAGTSQDKSSAIGAINSRLPSLHSSLLSPRMTTISSSHVSSGPASLSSAQWSPGRSSDPHLYSISGQPYSNASVKPYLSTSFKTSAERGAGISTTEARTGVEIEDEDDDDIFGSHGRSRRPRDLNEPSPPHIRRSNEVDQEEGDAAGVFSFSSPYFGPRSLETSDIPPLSPPPDGQSTSSKHHHASQRLMSPSWTAASLGKLSLGGPTESNNTPPKAPFGTSPHQSAGSASSSLYSRSLPSGVAQHPSSAQARRSSFNRRAHPGPGYLHPHTPYSQRSSARSRSTSRHRAGDRPERVMENVYDDDDETDDEVMATQDDDDATEDEAENQTRSRYSAGQNIARHSGGRTGEEGGGVYHQPMPVHRHPSGQQTTMSASYERAQSGLNRQYSSERYAHHALSRHHPYAMSPNGASSSNGGGVILSSYSPNNPRGPLGRRRSSFGNGNALSGSPSNSMMHALSHSPRYIQSIPTRDRPPMGLNGDQHTGHVGSYTKQGYPTAAHGYGESPDAAGTYRGGRYGVRELEEDEDEEEEMDGHDDGRSRRSAVRPTKPAARSTSGSRTAHAAATGEVESEEMTEVNAIRERLGGAANCSAFISKLWYLMCRPELYQKYIHWSESGDSVILSNDPDINNEFAAEVLPKLFKHGNNASFVRQLNLYGFQRVPSSRLLDAAEIKAARRFAHGANISTALQLYGPHSSFAHPRFKKDQESLLPSMKPRSSKKTKKVNGGDDSGAKAGGADSDGEEEFAM